METKEQKRISLWDIEKMISDYKEQCEKDIKRAKAIQKQIKKLGKPLNVWLVWSYDEDKGSPDEQYDIIYASFDREKAEKYAGENLYDDEGTPIKDSEYGSPDQVIGIEVADIDEYIKNNASSNATAPMRD